MRAAAGGLSLRLDGRDHVRPVLQPSTLKSEMNRANLSRRLLQVAAVLCAAPALLGGGLYLWKGIDGIPMFNPREQYDFNWRVVDSMFRAFAGVWFVLGLMLVWMIPSIEKHATWFTFACLAVFAMGLGRVMSLGHYGFYGSGLYHGAMIIELSLPQLLILWQRSVAKTSHADEQFPT